MLYNRLYNFLLVRERATQLASVSHLFSFGPMCLAPCWLPTSSAYMCVCSAPGWGLSHLQANYGRYLFSGRNKTHRIKFSAALFLDSILVCLVMSWFLVLRILHRCLEINPKAPWLTARRIVLSICWHACYSRLGLVVDHMWSLYLYLWPSTLHSSTLQYSARAPIIRFLFNVRVHFK